MIAYNKTLLENTFLASEAIDLKKSGLIQEEDLNKIKSELETLKTSRNLFVRFGFLMLGIFMFSSFFGFISAILLSDFTIEFSLIVFVLAIAGIIVLELLVNQNFFRHGLDDAFLIGTQMCFYIYVSILTESQIPVATAMIIMGFIYTIRYVSTLSFLVFLAGIVCLVGFFVIDHTTISSVLPFVLLAIAIGFYSIYLKIKNKEELYFYQNILNSLFIASLVLGYISINYFVVRTLSEELLYTDYSKSDIPFGWIFNILMFLIPLVYVIYALKQKNRTMLYIGGLTFVVSVGTFRYYHSIMPAEWALILSGGFIFGAVYLIIQKIKNQPTGITFQPDHSTNSIMLNTVEALIVNSQDMHQAQAPQDPDMPFGGGGFSGGGSGGSF